MDTRLKKKKVFIREELWGRVSIEDEDVLSHCYYLFLCIQANIPYARSMLYLLVELPIGAL